MAALLSLKELEASLTTLLSQGTPINLEPLKDHPLKANIWLSPKTQRLFKVTKIYDSTIEFQEGFASEGLFDYLREGNKWVFESDVADGRLVAYGSN